MMLHGIFSTACKQASAGRHPPCAMLLTKPGSKLSNIISLSSYDIFETPLIMVRKKPRYWTEFECREFFEWFMQIKPSRTNEILLASDALSAASEVERFQRVTETLHRSITHLTEQRLGGQAVNGLGVVAGFDAALVLGDALVRSVPGASWTTLRSPIRDLISNNLPGVCRHGTGPGFEPLMGGRLLLSLVGREPFDQPPKNVLHTVYQNWHRTLSEAESDIG